MANTVTDIQVAVYKEAIEAYARRFVGIANAEFDDLVQEGMIAVWMCQRDGYRPSEWMIKNRMKSWIRHLSRKGFGGYEALDESQL